MPWLLAISLLGFATGLRSMTPMAVLCWFAYCGRLPVADTWAGWTARLVVGILFTVLALGELVADKLPNTPNRTAPVGLGARLALGGLVGAILAASLHGSLVECVLLGAVGAVAGTFVGFLLRRGIVRNLGCADWPVALVEDLTTILIATFAFHTITG
jgi:uncharacterized membrane protein